VRKEPLAGTGKGKRIKHQLDSLVLIRKDGFAQSPNSAESQSIVSSRT
jgi:hypothetical protein